MRGEQLHVLVGWDLLTPARAASFVVVRHCRAGHFYALCCHFPRESGTLVRMAQKINVTLVDDIDGTEASETVTFGLDGVGYEIDLSSENAEIMRNDFATWVGAARRVGGRKKNAAAAKRRDDLDAIREWARANGYSVSDRGRIKAEVIDAYDNRNKQGSNDENTEWSA